MKKREIKSRFCTCSSFQTLFPVPRSCFSGFPVTNNYKLQLNSNPSPDCGCFITPLPPQMFTVDLYIKAYARLHPQTSSGLTASHQISFFFISFSGQNEINFFFSQTHYISATAGIFNLHYPSCCEGQISFDLNYLEKKKKPFSPKGIPQDSRLGLFGLV